MSYSLEKFSREKIPYYLLIGFILLNHVHGFKGLFIFQTDRALLFMDLGVFFLALGSLAKNHLFYNVKYWSVLAFALSLELILEHSYAPNSSFLYVYFSIAFALGSREQEEKERFAIWANSARLLLCVCLFYAGVQKLSCPFYTDGNLLSSLLMSEGLAYWVLKVHNPSFAEVCEELKQAYISFKMNAPAPPTSLPIIIPEEMVRASQALAFTTIGIELTLSLLCLFRRSYHWFITFIISAGLVLGIYAMADETEFLALICLLSYYANECKGWKAEVFLRGGAYFMLMTLIDFRPFFLG